MSARPSPITTRVAWCGQEEMRFCGWSAFDDLLGKESFLGLVALGLTGRRLTAREVALLDDLAVTNVAADPRIWPFKAARLLAARGDALAGAVGGQLCVLGGIIGPSVATGAAELLHELEIAVSTAQDGHDARAIIRSAVADRKKLYGFGVPYREWDARYRALVKCIRSRSFEDGPHCRLIDPLVEVMSELKPSLAPNSALPCAAVCLDLGFEPRQVGPFIMVTFFLPAIANACEESELRSSDLRELPVGSINYMGSAPRRSQRFVNNRND